MRVTKGEAFGTWIQRARNLLGFLRRVRRGYDFDQTTYGGPYMRNTLRPPHQRELCYSGLAVNQIGVENKRALCNN
jgi:hypothetical protein